MRKISHDGFLWTILAEMCGSLDTLLLLLLTLGEYRLIFLLHGYTGVSVPQLVTALGSCLLTWIRPKLFAEVLRGRVAVWKLLMSS